MAVPVLHTGSDGVALQSASIAHAHTTRAAVKDNATVTPTNPQRTKPRIDLPPNCYLGAVAPDSTI